MKIAIYHNLNNGGAKEQMKQWIFWLKKNKFKIIVYKPKETKTVSKNIFINICQTIAQSLISDYKIASLINKTKFDAILIFPCHKIQSPFILSFLKNKYKVIYIFAERNREFYENTSFFDGGIKKKISKIIRFPLKIFDITNCKQAINIVTNSYYSNYMLKKTYGKIGHVIYPGMEQIWQKRIESGNKITNFLSIGNLIKTKGHDFSIKQISPLQNLLTIIGSSNNNKEAEFIVSLAKTMKVNIKITDYIRTTDKLDIFKKTDIFLANQENEPFGISTAEANDCQIPVLGINIGGTSEIITTGINGFLYPKNVYIAKKILNKTLNNKIAFTQFNKINWKLSALKLIEYINKTILSHA
ncbi:glycosyltransferase family 4 protein [Candidatus Shapirobacteria bacterium]|nr:glycosyltransferase family 4 protein [Candidatus Shapirobacteria bacterium]